LYLIVLALILILTVYYIFKYPSFNLDINPRKKTVFVTGSASGIGKSLVNKLLQEGVYVFACDVNKEALFDTYKNVSDDKIKLLSLDVSDLSQIEQAAIQVAETLKHAHQSGHIESDKLFGIVNCAGVPTLTRTALMEKEDWELQKLFNVNVYGVHRCTRALYSLMAHDNSGCIVNIASVCGMIHGLLYLTQFIGMVALPFFGFYNATKYAVIGYTDTLRRELFDRVRVTCVEPGFTATPMVAFANELAHHEKYMVPTDWAGEMERLRNYVFNRWIANKLQKPENVADAIYSSLFSTNNPKHVIADRLEKRVMWILSTWQEMLDRFLLIYWRWNHTQKSKVL
jgi:NAD(P)-dependent dehydrogenase (short-subunit alcohol dehydrogenase family)